MIVRIGCRTRQPGLRSLDRSRPGDRRRRGATTRRGLARPLPGRSVGTPRRQCWCSDLSAVRSPAGDLVWTGSVRSGDAVDDLDELVYAVAVTAGVLDEFACSLHDWAAFMGGTSGSLVKAEVERGEHGVERVVLGVDVADVAHPDQQRPVADFDHGESQRRPEFGILCRVSTGWPVRCVSEHDGRHGTGRQRDAGGVRGFFRAEYPAARAHARGLVRRSTTAAKTSPRTRWPPPTHGGRGSPDTIHPAPGCAASPLTGRQTSIAAACVNQRRSTSSHTTTARALSNSPTASCGGRCERYRAATLGCRPVLHRRRADRRDSRRAPVAGHVKTRLSHARHTLARALQPTASEPR